LADSLFSELLESQRGSIRKTPLKDAVDAIIDYRGKSPNKATCGIPLITARVVKNKELLEPNEFIAADVYEDWMRRGLPMAGDVIFTTEAPLGEVAQLDERRVALAQRLLVLRGKPTVLDNTFLMFALTSPDVVKEISARSTGSTVRGIRQRELREVLLPLPPFQVQQKFASCYHTLVKLKAVHRTSENFLRDLFKSLQHRAFRGEL
jgi:type I restriction enzyme S subunit